MNDTILFIALSYCLIALVTFGILHGINRIKLYFAECVNKRTQEHVASYGVCYGTMEKERICWMCPHYYKNLREE